MAWHFSVGRPCPTDPRFVALGFAFRLPCLAPGCLAALSGAALGTGRRGWRNPKPPPGASPVLPSGLCGVGVSGPRAFDAASQIKSNCTQYTKYSARCQIVFCRKLQYIRVLEAIVNKLLTSSTVPIAYTTTGAWQVFSRIVVNGGRLNPGGEAGPGAWTNAIAEA